MAARKEAGAHLSFFFTDQAFKLKSELMVGGADILVAGIAYVVPDWKIFIVTVGSIGRGVTIWKLKILSMCPY